MSPRQQSQKRDSPMSPWPPRPSKTQTSDDQTSTSTLPSTQRPAESERHRLDQLHWEETMRGAGDFLRDALRRDARARIQLQHVHESAAPSCAARCCGLRPRATRAVAHYRAEVYFAHVGQRLREHYHVGCLEAMVALAPLVGAGRFAMRDDDGRRGEDWGIMLRAWFEHGGRIDVGAVWRYLRALDGYARATHAFMVECEVWEKTRCDPAIKPPYPRPPRQPRLEKYVTETPCALADVLLNPFHNMFVPHYIRPIYRDPIHPHAYEAQEYSV